ncbi:MAG: hypothetical protein NUV35_05650, partial [Syntrophomonadaceae bacterium]|nr:hypothetical protein [Syntrophomonadaceae bacterium]
MIALVALIAWRSVRENGMLVYALDDAYIHMAVAKNLILHHVWGVTAGHFSSSTSSLLWPSLLAALFAIFGINDSIPLVLNAILALG